MNKSQYILITVFFDISKTSHVYVCTGCKSFHLQPLAKMKENNSFIPMTGPIVNGNCEHCGNKFHVINYNEFVLSFYFSCRILKKTLFFLGWRSYMEFFYT